MAKKTVFTGVINGEKFDNVVAYNARMNELLSAGVEDISASSSTEIKIVDDVPSNMNNVSTTYNIPGVDNLPVDEDLSHFPYFEDDDPFYLDILVTDNPITNQEAYEEAQKVLEKCYRYTVNDLNDPNVLNDTRRDYLNDITEIISEIKSDIRDTNNAADSIAAKRQKLQEDYESEMRKLDEEDNILRASARITSMFQAYYEDIQNEIMVAIKNHECDCNGNCGPDCKCDCHNDVETACKEVRPPLVEDFNKLIDRVFSEYGIIRR